MDNVPGKILLTSVHIVEIVAYLILENVRADLNLIYVSWLDRTDGHRNACKHCDSCRYINKCCLYDFQTKP